MKDTFFFPHDYNARHDPKLISLQMMHGLAGLGAYWSIIEMLYEEGGIMQMDCERIAFALRTDCVLINSLINDFKLFEINGENFTSNSVLKRLEVRNSKSVKARESALNRWKNANAMRTQCDGNAIKERKGKEIKGNKIKENKEKPNGFTPDLSILDPVWKKLIDDWIDHCRAIKKPFKNQKQVDFQIKKLISLSGGDSIIAQNIIEHCIGNRYQGLYIPNDRTNGRTQKNSGASLEELAEIVHSFGTNHQVI